MLTASPPSLGTQLRRLIELLDGDLERHYLSLNLNYRPRYTPIVRALEALGPSSIRSISLYSNLTHSAVSQTVAQMAKAGLVQIRAGDDARERIAAPTPRLVAILPTLHAQWDMTDRAAEQLDTELRMSLLILVGEAISALERRPFGERLLYEKTNPSTPTKPQKPVEE